MHAYLVICFQYLLLSPVGPNGDGWEQRPRRWVTHQLSLRRTENRTRRKLRCLRHLKIITLSPEHKIGRFGNPDLISPCYLQGLCLSHMFCIKSPRSRTIPTNDCQSEFPGDELIFDESPSHPLPSLVSHSCISLIRKCDRDQENSRSKTSTSS